MSLAIDSNGRTIWIADAHRGDGQHFIVHADEKLTAFVELESAIRDKPVSVAPTLLIVPTAAVSWEDQRRAEGLQ